MGQSLFRYIYYILSLFRDIGDIASFQKNHTMLQSEFMLTRLQVLQHIQKFDKGTM